MTIDDVEAIAARLAGVRTKGEDVTVDLSEMHWIALSAGARLANILRIYAEVAPVSVILPPLMKGAESLGSQHANWQVQRSFLQSGLSQAIAQNVQTILYDKKDIRDAFREKYLDKTVLESDFCFISRLHSGTSVNINDFDAFAAQFRRWEEKLPTPLAQQSATDFGRLAQMCFEAIQNVYDHASRSPLPSGTQISSFFSLCYHSAMPRNIGTHLSGYLRRYSASTIGPSQPLIEILISDDGVGLPARYVGSLEIYEGPIAEEEAALGEALRDGGSVKLKYLDSIVRGDPGYGFTKIDSSVINLRGWASIRTGRLHAVMDSTRHVPVQGSAGFKLVKAQFGYDYTFIPGFILQALIPLSPSPQAKLGLA